MWNILKIVLLTAYFSCVKAINEQEVLSAFVDVYDKMYEIRDDHAKQIEQLNNKDMEKTKQIESLKLQLEEMKKRIAPATCAELSNQGIVRDQEIFLDSDGINYGEKPVKAFCSFPSNNVTFGEEKHVNITHCEGQDCFQSDFQVDNSTLNQMQNVIEASTSCSQKWLFNCVSASLKQTVSLEFSYLHKLNIPRFKIKKDHGPKNLPLGCNFGPKLKPHVGRSALKN